MGREVNHTRSQDVTDLWRINNPVGVTLFSDALKLVWMNVEIMRRENM